MNERILINMKFTDKSHDTLESITVNLKDYFAEYGYIPRTEAIPIELYEQVKGERDTAIEQLQALNIELFEKPYLKAIPIDWIYRWRLKNMDKCPVDFIPFSNLLNDWEKENEKDSE